MEIRLRKSKDFYLASSSRLRDRAQEPGFHFAGDCDAAVIGAGHAGIEAALALARRGFRTFLFTMSLDSLANLPCNPNIGGTAKGQLAREVDALGGAMGVIADECCLQFRMLNASRGPAVHSPRVQVDRSLYHRKMKECLEAEEALFLRQTEITDIFLSDEDASVLGVLSKTKAFYPAKCVIVAGGTYLRSRVIIGEIAYSSGPDHLFPAAELSEAIVRAGHGLRRYKTGTPVRVQARSLDFSKMEIQKGDEGAHYMSYLHEYGLRSCPPTESLPCYVTYTNEKTEKVIRDNLHRSPLFSGMIEATGTRYCPSIEDKIVKFPDKERHQIFVEPIALNSGEMYLSGLSSSMPEEVQETFLRTLPGFEQAEIHRIGYAIEYDCIDAQELELSLESKFAPGLFFAGQVNGTSGYEEAAAQGLIAGMNAGQKIRGEKAVILDRSQAYIGVMIDDLVTKGSREPYRMMTARAEYRLLLRQDNADQRLTPLAYELGLVDEARYQACLRRQEKVENELRRLKETSLRPSEALNTKLKAAGTSELKESTRLYDLLKRPQLSYGDLAEFDPNRPSLSVFEQNVLDIRIRYEGYIALEEERVERFRRLEEKRLPEDLDYEHMEGLRLEARQKLSMIRPKNIGQAGRISGVTPADLSVLMIRLEAERRKRAQTGRENA